ncbi:hypothetical protein NMP99_13185 [Glutamicibacter mishrai]|uniref:hypothetical protein n=1 Tax=Glutamicibacter mishrai TaxID=1775880 RepID=UPI0020CE9C6F|nr:hypothetical protein [Glutamicibacter mishrai]UTT38956.1 hypothetical protein NMP99_13185 [Glutamicibacter mishrai]
MRITMRRSLAALGSVTLAITLAGPVQASTGEPNTLSTIESISPWVLEDVAEQSIQSAGRMTLKNPVIQGREVSGLSVVLPEKSIEGVKITGAAVPKVTIGLPQGAGSSTQERAGVVSFDNGNDSKTVPVIKDDGSVQIATVIEGPGAPTKYKYPIAVPAGAKLVATDDGGAKIIDSGGDPLGVFLPPWAIDADGKDVKTHYEIEDSALIQVVRHHEGSSYPIIADPTYVTTTYWYSRRNVEDMWKALKATDSFCKVISLLPIPYPWGVGCGWNSNLGSKVTQAHYEMKRIRAIYNNCGATYCNYYEYRVLN